jgi:hypothetical protein
MYVKRQKKAGYVPVKKLCCERPQGLQGNNLTGTFSPKYKGA